MVLLMLLQPLVVVFLQTIILYLLLPLLKNYPILLLSLLNYVVL
jgi:hypothetical protein